MPYIVKSTLDILPWNEVEKQKLIKEKEEYLKKEPVIVEEETDETETEQKVVTNTGETVEEVEGEDVESPVEETEKEIETEKVEETGDNAGDNAGDKANDKEEDKEEKPATSKRNSKKAGEE